VTLTPRVSARTTEPTFFVCKSKLALDMIRFESSLLSANRKDEFVIKFNFRTKVVNVKF
jgi:hypothetical protein